MKSPAIKSFTAFAIVSMAACSAPVRPAPKPEAAAKTTTNLTNGKWYLSSEIPATFYPVGMKRDAATGFRDGEWIYAGELGAKWFIPNDGAGRLTKPELIADALSMRTEAQKRKLASEDRADFAKHSLQATALVASLPATLPAAMIWDFINPGL